MSAARILLIGDSEALRDSIAAALDAGGFHVWSRPDGTQLESDLVSFAPDLVLLDVMLPGRDDFRLLDVIRHTSAAAVVMLTAHEGVADQVHGLAADADDYVMKPFAITELLARLQAVLRRTRRAGSAVSVADLVINEDASRVERDGEVLDLTDTERRLLAFLAARHDRVVSKAQILAGVWGYEGYDQNVVEVQISGLRRKIERPGRPRVLHTIRGRGYLLGVR